jgi:TolB-like protein/Tfp pilus assembly protein PilF
MRVRQPRVKSNRRALLLSAFVVAFAVLALASVYLWTSRRSAQTTDADARVKSIAVLPFQPLVPQGGDVYLELGMADALITRLSNIRQVTVRPTSAVMMYTAPERNAAEIGRQLGVDAVLDGRLQKAGERVRVTVQLIRVRDGSPLWADTFDEEFTNIFGVQDSISQRMADALTLSLTREEKQSLTKRYTENAEAYQLYMRGRFHWYKWTEEGWRKSRDYFEQAIARDPNYALAYAGLSDAYSVLGFIAPPRETYLKAKEAALKALELDDTLAEAHLSLGALSMFEEWNRPAAKVELERALALNPNSAQAHDLHAIYLASEGRADEALAESARAGTRPALALHEHRPRNDLLLRAPLRRGARLGE